MLREVRVLDTRNGTFRLHTEFQTQLRNALSGGGDAASFGAVVPTSEKHIPSAEHLDAHAQARWEAVLHFLVGTPGAHAPVKGLLLLLQTAGLMAPRKDLNDGARMDVNGAAPGRLEITSGGFQFLLQDSPAQIWRFLLSFVEQAPRMDLDQMDVLHFVLLLPTLQFGMDYAVEQLTESQRALLSDFSALGLIERTSVMSCHLQYLGF